ncbi:MAG: hypothetical protein SGI91_22085 [Alphaproteobacteria bacterium]|jgi:hypothetical protein|nr:hypothetical protein [Alphaproteobacteria bacterium]
MSVDFAYMRRSVDAAFDLVVRDQRAWSKFDLTAEGFYRSFAAMFVVLPLNIVIDLIANQVAAAERIRQGKPAVDAAYGFADALFSTVALSVQWLLFPIAMIFLLRYLDLAQRYATLIIAHNWATVVIWLFYLPPFLLYAAGIISSSLAIDLNLVILGLTLYYRFYIAQTALGTTWLLAAGIAMIDFLLQANFLFGLSQIAGLWVADAT